MSTVNNFNFIFSAQVKAIELTPNGEQVTFEDGDQRFTMPTDGLGPEALAFLRDAMDAESYVSIGVTR